MAQKRKINRNKLNLFLDIALTAIFVVDMEESFTGLNLHELLGLFFAALLVVHIILHWDWIVSITRTFFRKVFHESRLNYVLNVALFVDVVIMTITGIIISRTIGLSIPLSDNADILMETAHVVTAQLSLILTGLHVALHWKWILAHLKKYVFVFKRLTVSVRTPVAQEQS